MLVLSRKQGQRIHVGQDVTIVINRIRGNVVSVGIEAPEQVPIRRGEIADQPNRSPQLPPIDSQSSPPIVGFGYAA